MIINLKTFEVPSFHIRTREQYEQHVNHPEGSFIGFFPSLQGIKDQRTNGCFAH